ncbi:MAG TPA: polysaccharide pyruvyl transferase family protein [Gordonia sp. (in: high G+C Gram-positive bacteria)]|uniref:polysaccharide pyruvyl transferase family protein n=1 Tax=unclassified Gordonia (in: high G+C Gram-positive bacteria) TaxID=2657482 RepID=UPI0025B7EDF6|nr:MULTISPECIES: polysaccharide pyruvyl transferase family protein [unclassified Gordonia (in: high G+C Gram-positive bacteria)]HNP56379.1 polysaccharide pyruvyl transferase family protein [Gordonia sp. (in: high G+C Gram-positive bacteria)]HRC51871.1 polysaccharide pyruvyl transferase family protein [Gordonia sp. (in: high G+C Gram-positive bacteria)]
MTSPRMTTRIARAVRPEEVVYLVAPSGFPNYGDELIAATWLAHLRRTRPRATVVLDCHTPGQASLLLRNANPRAVFTDTLWRLTEHARAVAEREIDDDAVDPARPWEWVAAAASSLGVVPAHGEGVDLLLRASSLHLVGGGYVNRQWRHHTSLLVAMAAVGRQTGARVFATGQGLLPLLEEPEWSALKKALEGFDIVDVRDAASREALDGLALREGGRVTASGDDVWLALPQRRWGDRVIDELRRRRGADPLPSGGVVLCLQSDLIEDFTFDGTTGVPALADYADATLRHWGVPPERVTVIEAIPGHDYTVVKELGDRLAGARIVPFLSVWRDGLPIGAGQTWLTTRFHPHLIAAAAGDSGAAVVTKPDYYGTKHASLVDCGSRWTVADGTSVPDRPTAGGFSPADRSRNVDAKRALARECYPPRSPRRR